MKPMMEATGMALAFEQQPREGNKGGTGLRPVVAGVPPGTLRRASLRATGPRPVPGRSAPPQHPTSDRRLLSPDSPANSALPLLTRRDLAAHLQVSVRTIDRMVAIGEIPCHRIGKAVRFHLPDVLKAMRE